MAKGSGAVRGGDPEPTSLVDAWVGLCEEVEARTGQDVRKTMVARFGWARSTVYAWQEMNGDSPRVSLPALAVQQATAHFGCDRILKALCANLGYLCIRIPETRALGLVDLRRPIRQGADAVEAYLTALEDDGVVDRVEAAEHVIPEIDEAIAAYQELRAQVLANAQERPAFQPFHPRAV